MTKTLAVDAKNDIFIGADGSLSVASGLAATLQAAQQAAQTQLGEMEYAVDEGLPNFAVVWAGVPNLSQFEAALRTALLGVDGVTGIQELNLSQSDNTLSYRAVIATVYGTGAVNG